MATKCGDNASDEIIDKKCSVCAGKNVTREAEKYCVECQDYYCIPCTDTHRAFPAMRGHKLLDKADFSTQSLHSSLPCFPTERCSIHKAKLLDMYCKNHDEVVCATCVAINHRSCQDIHSIPDEVDNLFKQLDPAETMKQLTAEMKAAEDIMKGKQDMLGELKKQKKTATDTITDYRKELEAEIKKLENESIKEVDAKYKSIERDLQADMKETEKHIGDLKQSTANLQKSNGNKAQEYVCVKIAQKNIDKATNSKRTLNKTINVKIVFYAEMKIKNYLKQLDALGLLSTSKQRTTAYTVKQQKNIDIKVKRDTFPCCTWGSCITEDGSLLLTDFDNEKLKRLHVSTETITDHLDLETSPVAVCQTNTQEAAVSLNNSTIQFVSLGKKMATTKKLNMDHHCCGLAYDDGKLFISDENDTVYIHDITGTMLHKITTDKSGKPIFIYTKHISLSSDRMFLHVTDYKKGLITLDTQGNYLSTFTDPELVSPSGVCTDGRGNIFVCGLNSSNIVQINENSMTKSGIIRTDNHPQSVCFVPHQNKLVVTHYASNTITIYELQ